MKNCQVVKHLAKHLIFNMPLSTSNCSSNIKIYLLTILTFRNIYNNFRNYKLQIIRISFQEARSSDQKIPYRIHKIATFALNHTHIFKRKAPVLSVKLLFLGLYVSKQKRSFTSLYLSYRRHSFRSKIFIRLRCL